MKKLHRSSRGIPIDFDALQAANPKTIAVGNARYNARGDLLGDNGRVSKTAEQIAQETTITTVDQTGRTRNVSIKNNLDDLKSAREGWYNKGAAADVDPEEAMDISQAIDLLDGKAPTVSKPKPKVETKKNKPKADPVVEVAPSREISDEE